MNISLYEMTNDLAELLNISEDEITEEQKSEITNTIMDMIKNKSENIIKVIRNFETRIDAVKNEEKRLTEYRKSEEKKLENLKKYTINCLQQANIKNIDTNLGKVSVRKNPASVEIIDALEIPQEFMITKQVTEINKKALKEVMKKGTTVRGAVLNDNKYSLSVK